MSDSFDDSDDSGPLGTYSSDSTSSSGSDSDSDYDDGGLLSPDSPAEDYFVDRDMYHYDSDMSMVSLNCSDGDPSVEVDSDGDPF